VLGVDEVMATPSCLVQTPVERFAGLRGHWQLPGSDPLGPPDRVFDVAADRSRIGAENLQHPGDVAVTDESEQQVRCSDVLAVTRIGFVVGMRDDAPRTLAEHIKQRLSHLCPFAVASRRTVAATRPLRPLEYRINARWDPGSFSATSSSWAPPAWSRYWSTWPSPGRSFSGPPDCSDCPAKLGSLLAIGTSICGVSAIVAAKGAIRARNADVRYAIAASR
jgi:hypothetical protein